MDRKSRVEIVLVLSNTVQVWDPDYSRFSSLAGYCNVLQRSTGIGKQGRVFLQR